MAVISSTIALSSPSNSGAIMYTKITTLQQ
jgi:hypothetical protein